MVGEITESISIDASACLLDGIRVQRMSISGEYQIANVLDLKTPRFLRQEHARTVGGRTLWRRVHHCVNAASL